MSSRPSASRSDVHEAHGLQNEVVNLGVQRMLLIRPVVDPIAVPADGDQFQPDEPLQLLTHRPTANPDCRSSSRKWNSLADSPNSRRKISALTVTTESRPGRSWSIVCYHQTIVRLY